MRGSSAKKLVAEFRSLRDFGTLRWIVLVAIFLLALGLRWSLNGTWRLGPDEALYSTWARHIASGADPWLASTPGVDKPPLLMYAIALSMNVYGYFEFASRFPSIIASTLTVLLTYLLAWRLYRRAAIALVAALLLALSPFAILYAPTAFADPLMVMWLLLAAALVAYEQWTAAGVAAALAILTKQEALLLLPLVVVWIATIGPDRSDVGRGLLRFAVACAIVAVGVELLWEAMRPGQPSPFALGLAHYGGIALVAPSQIPPRLAEWWQTALRYVFASPVLNVLLFVSPVALVWAARRPPAPKSGGEQSSDRRADVMILLVVAYAILARTIVSFQMWDRYMLFAAPLLCILLARGVDAVLAVGGQRIARTLASLVLAAALLASPVADALPGRIPVGSDHGDYWGIDETARFVRENVAPGSVIYHDDLGWQLSYYLYGAHLDFWWYPSLDWLAQTAAGRAEHSQYIIVPSWAQEDSIAVPLAAHKLRLLPVHSALRPDGSVSFRTYRIAAQEDEP
jgi:4-amino-4-deoxy-L-arabinose transferase-like glycosyltransferase